MYAVLLSCTISQRSSHLRERPAETGQSREPHRRVGHVLQAHDRWLEARLLEHLDEVGLEDERGRLPATVPSLALAVACNWVSAALRLASAPETSTPGALEPLAATPSAIARESAAGPEVPVIVASETLMTRYLTPSLPMTLPSLVINMGPRTHRQPPGWPRSGCQPVDPKVRPAGMQPTAPSRSSRACAGSWRPYIVVDELLQSAPLERDHPGHLRLCQPGTCRGGRCCLEPGPRAAVRSAHRIPPCPRRRR